MTKIRKGRGPKRPQVSVVIAGLLIASGLVRLADGTGAAIAREVAALGPAPTGIALREDPAAEMEIEALMATLRERGEAMDKREADLDIRERDIAAALALIEAQMEELRTAEADLNATISQAEAASETDVARLTSVYESMKPKQAALVFQEMEPEFAAGFLGRMRPASAAAIFASLTPDAAYSISVILAGRNAGAPTE